MRVKRSLFNEIATHLSGARNDRMGKGFSFSKSDFGFNLVIPHLFIPPHTVGDKKGCNFSHLSLSCKFQSGLHREYRHQGRVTSSLNDRNPRDLIQTLQGEVHEGPDQIEFFSHLYLNRYKSIPEYDLGCEDIQFSDRQYSISLPGN